MADEPRLLRKLNFERLLGYSYSGILLLFIVAIIEPIIITPIINSLGVVLVILMVFALGATIYVIHRYVLGEIFLYPFLHLAHLVWDRIWGRSGLYSTSTTSYLGALGVRLGERRAAYNVVREQFFHHYLRDRLDIAHGEVHMLWITVDELLVASAYLIVIDRHAIVLLSISLIIAVCATIADIRQHQFESHFLKHAEHRGKLRPFLEEIGYLSSQNEQP